MKILIGTPIHKNYDNLMKKWLKNVSKLEYPADFLMVDSSSGLNYVEKVKEYCSKNRIKNYQIEHIDVHQENGMDEMIGRSREIIRQYILSHNYDAWFSWECDQLIPADTLDKLVEVMEEGGFTMVCNLEQGKFSINPKAEPNDDFGCVLIRRNSLEKYGFLLEYPNMPNTWHAGARWFKKRLIGSGGRYIEVKINPVRSRLPSIDSYMKKAITASNGVKLNLGCGRKHKKSYINIDIQKPCDVRHDLRTPLPFDSNSIDEIFSEDNFICHFSFTKWGGLKKEMVRVLKVGGKLEIIFADFEYSLKAFLDNREGTRWTKWLQIIFGGQKNQYDFCKNGFTYHRLASELSQEGMVNFKTKKAPEPGYIHLVCFKYKQKQL